MASGAYSPRTRTARGKEGAAHASNTYTAYWTDGRTATALPADPRPPPQDRKRKRKREGEYLDIHLSGFRGLCRRFLPRLSQTEVAISAAAAPWSNLFPVAVEGKNNPRGTPLVVVLLITLRFGDTKL